MPPGVGESLYDPQLPALHDRHVAVESWFCDAQGDVGRVKVNEPPAGFLFRRHSRRFHGGFAESNRYERTQRFAHRTADLYEACTAFDPFFV